MAKDKWIFENKYVVFYFSRVFDISFELCGYFDNRPRINLDMFFFSLTLIFPFRNSWTDECDPPKWGIAYHNQIFWIYRGGKGNMNGGNKWWAFHMPWSYDWVRTSCLRKDGKWEHDIAIPTLNNSVKRIGKNFWEDKWKDVLWNESYPYVYTLKNGTVQNRIATLHLEEREWRPRALKWTSLFKRTDRSIKVDFNDEVGEETGSWKGGIVGCGYTVIDPELPEQTLRRMEKERKF